MKVSVIIPVYNAAPFLDKSIKSALDQKQTGEVLLIDDRSTDKSLEICKRWELLDSRVKVFINDGTKGAGAARNVGLSHAGCDYVAFLDADDYYLEGRFDETEKLFLKNNDLECVSESVKIKAYHSKTVQTLTGNFENDQIVGFKNNYSKIALEDYFTKNVIFMHGITLKRNVITKIGSFDESLKQTQDTDLLIRILNKCNVYSGTYANPIVVYIIHENNRIHNFYDAAFYRRKLMNKHLKSSLISNYSFTTILYLFRYYIEYEYLLEKPIPNLPKLAVKLLYLPKYLINLFAKNDPQYNPN